MRTVQEILTESRDVKSLVLADELLLKNVLNAGELMVESFRSGGKSMFCGNGGSAADAQHFAAELSGRFLFDRDPLPAEALHGNTSFLTCVANDYAYDLVYARAVRSSGRAGDVLVVLSTSGQSPNVVRAAEAAVALGIHVIALTGERSGPLAELATVWISVPSTVTGRIQEAHIAIIHAVSEQVEATLFEAPVG